MTEADDRKWQWIAAQYECQQNQRDRLALIDSRDYELHEALWWYRHAAHRAKVGAWALL